MRVFRSVLFSGPKIVTPVPGKPGMWTAQQKADWPSYWRNYFRAPEKRSGYVPPRQ